MNQILFLLTTPTKKIISESSIVRKCQNEHVKKN